MEKAEKTGSGTLRLPRLVGDGMVLQRDIPLTVWGWAAPGRAVTVSLLGKTYEGAADAEGKWRVTLPPMGPGGPYELTVSADTTVTVKNILVGDVWICAGQSNMQLTMDRVRDKYPEDVKNCENDNIRLYTVEAKFDFKKEADDLETGSWVTPRPDTILSFTAVGFFFAKELYARYRVPIGLICSAIGGTPVEAWISEEALKAFPKAREQAAPFKDDGHLEKVAKENERAIGEWFKTLSDSDIGSQGDAPWYAEDLDDADWGEISIPSFWPVESPGADGGIVWYRKEIDVPASMTGIPARLFLGTIVDSDMTYINGQFVGSVGYQYPPRKYDIPGGVLKPGRNVITVRVVCPWGKGGFNPDKPYELTAGGQTIDLTGLWKYKRAAVAPPFPMQVFVQNLPVGLFNGMKAPLFYYKIKGVIWYQGESNTANAGEYHALFETMIQNWRARWGQGDFPFLFVQLPNFGEAAQTPGDSDWALVREAQLKTLRLPNTGMAVTYDVGEWNDLHPLDKKSVAHRLFLAARKVAYGETDVVWSGPIVSAAEVSGNKVILRFDHVGSGLVAKGGAPGGFDIKAEDGVFLRAQAEIEGDTVIVWNDAVLSPYAVRYAWADNPEGANLYNAEGLPASPFRASL